MTNQSRTNQGGIQRAALLIASLALGVRDARCAGAHQG